MRAPAGAFDDAEHPAVNVRGDPGEQPSGWRAEPGRPVPPDEVVVATDPAGGDDDGTGLDGELADALTGGGDAAGRGVEGEAAPCTPYAPSGPTRMSSTQWRGGSRRARRESPAGPGRRRARRRRDRSPGHVEAGTELPWPPAVPSPRSAQPTTGNQRTPEAVQPGALLPGGELDIGAGPLARPVVLGPVEARGSGPVLPCQFETVSCMPRRRCSGESTRKSPRRTSGPGRRGWRRSPGRGG